MFSEKHLASGSSANSLQLLQFYKNMRKQNRLEQNRIHAKDLRQSSRPTVWPLQGHVEYIHLHFFIKIPPTPPVKNPAKIDATLHSSGPLCVLSTGDYLFLLQQFRNFLLIAGRAHLCILVKLCDPSPSRQRS